tara:strand:+ start:7827 stop:8525 length:699 start_codon:yes stop_codon:yes gene_type:complete
MIIEEEEAPEAEITFTESRVLGCLLEKEKTTPDHYPMTLNGLQSACNQKSSREPVTEFDECVIENALMTLRDKHLAAMVRLSGSRVPKYKHTFENNYNLDEGQIALLCVLMLRGIQTAGELNQRTERIHNFSSVAAVEHTLETLIDYPPGALVRKLPPGHGRRVTTYAHLLCGEPENQPIAVSAGGGSVSTEQIVLEEEASWRKKLEDEVAALRTEVAELRETLEQFRQQFE